MTSRPRRCRGTQYAPPARVTAWCDTSSPARSRLAPRRSDGSSDGSGAIDAEAEGMLTQPANSAGVWVPGAITPGSLDLRGFAPRQSADPPFDRGGSCPATWTSPPTSARDFWDEPEPPGRGMQENQKGSHTTSFASIRGILPETGFRPGTSHPFEPYTVPSRSGT
jgi:hypothetical protein